MIFEHEHFFIFAENVGAEFVDEASDLDITDALVTAEVKQNFDDTFEVEFLKIEAVLKHGSGLGGKAIAYFDVINSISSETKETFRHNLIEKYLEKIDKRPYEERL